MNRKNICKQLALNFGNWVRTIDDNRVKDLVQKNSLITGGSIFSLFHNQTPNDFDVYFTNKETVLAVANYYANKFNQNGGHEVKRVTVLDSADYSWVETPEQAEKIGGKALGMIGTDRVKLWMDGSGMLGEKREWKEGEERPAYRPVFFSANAITLSDKIQIVIRFFGDAKEIHRHYDFLHCSAYWESANPRELHATVEIMDAIMNKELVYNGSLYPLASIFRTRKFIQRGFSCPVSNYLKMALQLDDLDLKDPNVLDDQLTGVDVAYFSEIIDYIRKRLKKEPTFKLTNAYLFEIIDRIFDGYSPEQQ